MPRSLLESQLGATPFVPRHWANVAIGTVRTLRPLWTNIPTQALCAALTDNSGRTLRAVCAICAGSALWPRRSVDTAFADRPLRTDRALRAAHADVALQADGAIATIESGRAVATITAVAPMAQRLRCTRRTIEVRFVVKGQGQARAANA